MKTDLVMVVNSTNLLFVDATLRSYDMMWKKKYPVIIRTEVEDYFLNNYSFTYPWGDEDIIADFEFEIHGICGVFTRPFNFDKSVFNNTEIYAMSLILGNNIKHPKKPKEKTFTLNDDFGMYPRGLDETDIIRMAWGKNQNKKYTLDKSVLVGLDAHDLNSDEFLNGKQIDIKPFLYIENETPFLEGQKVSLEWKN